MSDEIPAKEVRKLALKLAVARDVFARAFDDSAAESGSSVTFKQIAAARRLNAPADENLRQGDQLDFAAAMLAANKEGWLVDFVFDRFSDLAERAAPEQTHQLQSIAKRKQRFEDARQIEAGTLAALRRCCRLVRHRPGAEAVEPEALGTGFLVGPHLVLTCFHVIAPLLDAEAKPRRNAGKLMAQFDYHMGSADFRAVAVAPADWLVAHHRNLAQGEAETQASLAGSLDYAVVRLDGRPGDARGYYDLSQVRTPPAVGHPVDVWQFPDGQPMKVVTNNRAAPPGRVAFAAEADDGATHPRIYYFANTLGGSSGGLVLGPDKRPVGLHDAGFDEKKAVGDERVNRAIPLHLVSAEALTPVSQALGNIPAKLGWHPRRALPLIGRQRLQDHIFDAQRGPGRIITVISQPDPDTRERKPRIGRSFTRLILESCLEPARHHVLVLPASRIDTDPFVTARRIVATIDPARAAALPGATGNTTLDADATGRLVEDTVAALAEAAPGKTVWLVIDDIDAHPIGTQWASSSYLMALYRRVAEDSPLRVVLTGLPRRLEGLNDLKDAILEETLDDQPSLPEITDWLDAHLANNIGSDEFTTRLSRLMSAIADEDLGRSSATVTLPAVHCQTEALAGLIERHARKAFNGARG